MALLCRAIPSILGLLRGRDGGQATIEYFLATGVLAVVIAAVFVGMAEAAVPAILDFMCDTVDPLGGGDCLTF